MKDYAIIYNPTSAAGKSKIEFDLACKTLSSLGIQYDLFHTERFGHGIGLATQLANDGYRIIGAGGDGTCNEVFNGAMLSSKKPLVGFIPMGSGNDIPGAIGIKPDVKRACEIIAEGKTGTTDIGLSINAQKEKRWFLGIGSQGFDAEVTKRTNEAAKTKQGTKNYVAMVLKTVFSFKKRPIRMTCDSEKFEGLCNLVAVGNGPSYGGWMFICQHATVHDGMFHITIVDMGNLPLLINFNKMYSKTLMPHPKVKVFSSKRVKIEMINQTDQPYIAQVDGEIIGDLPVEYEIIPEGYEFIRPETNEVEAWFMAKFGKKYEQHCAKFPQ